MNELIRLENVDLVFGPKPEPAFRLLDQGRSRQEIQKSTGQVVAIHGLSLQVFPGEILVIMGLSGSGKSSLLRCFNGMNGRGDRNRFGKLRGRILYKGSEKVIDIGDCSRSELVHLRRHEMSMVFQQFGLMPWRTVLENVAFPLEIQGIGERERNRRALEKLTLVGLEEWKHRMPCELSGGMQQRVGLARAFVTQAPVLLMDEPFSALDPLHRRQLQDEILSLQRTLRKTVIFVTHDPTEAMRIATRIAVLDAGKLLQIDSPEELSSNPNSNRVHQLTAIQSHAVLSN